MNVEELVASRGHKIIQTVPTVGKVKPARKPRFQRGSKTEAVEAMARVAMATGKIHEAVPSEAGWHVFPVGYYPNTGTHCYALADATHAYLIDVRHKFGG